MHTVGIRELKNQLSRHLKRVRAGHPIVITERGRPIATIVPVERPQIPEGLLRLLKEGKAHWSGGKPVGARMTLRAPGARLAEAVLEDREDRV
ncbi:MAG: hypothetical protein DMG00_25200 [Acidobacteria bacterium]|nr:MAG: hypothetical protein DMG00_25200 [Acidobacteriota bacterium]